MWLWMWVCMYVDVDFHVCGCEWMLTDDVVYVDRNVDVDVNVDMLM